MTAHTTPAVPALAASVILISPLQTPASDGCNYRVALLKRKAKGSFASAVVWPGGNVSRADSDAVWDEMLPLVSADERQSRTLRLAAIREVFEECGVLLEGQSTDSAQANDPPRRSPPPSDAQQWRERIHSDASQFVELFRERRSEPDVAALALRARWITPRNNPRRWDTWFYLALLEAKPDSDSHVLLADGKEVFNAEWLTPKEALRRAFAQEIKMMPPQVYTLGDLPADWRDLLEPGSTTRLKAVSAAPWEPVFSPVQSDDGQDRVATLLPGDAAHPDPERRGQVHARNRNYLDPEALGRGDFVVYGSVRRGVPGYADFGVGQTFEKAAKSRL